MKFVNNTGSKVKVRLGKHKSYYWKTLDVGEEIDLSKRTGERLGFDLAVKTKDSVSSTKSITITSSGIDPSTTSSTILSAKVSPKNKPDPNKEYIKILKSINGIGPKTIKDILRVYKTAKELIRAIDAGKKLPFRDDVAIKLKKKLKRKYGGRHG